MYENQTPADIGSAAITNAASAHLMEMRCPACKKIQHFKIRSGGDHLTGCTSCDTRLVVTPQVQQKPNAIKISLAIVVVPSAPKLRVVSEGGAS